jgi:hypothetical protein
MPIVQNLARLGDIIDPAYCTYNRKNAGDPNGSLTPGYVGEMVLDTTDQVLWKALDLVNNSWVALTGPHI